MGRFLFVVPPLTGHTNPTVAVGAALEARGHRVAWAGEPSVVGPLLPEGAALHAAPEGLPAAMAEALEARGQGLRGAAALKFLWDEVLHPLALAMHGPVTEAVDAFGPDVVVADQQAVAGAVVARQRGLPWATSATTSAELTRPLDGLPKIAEWVESSLEAVQVELGVDEADAREGDLRFSPHLVLAFTSEALVGAEGAFPDHYACVGPSIDVDRPPVEFPWEWLDDERPLVLVSLGTVNQQAGERFYGVAVEAVADLDVQAVLVAPPELVGTVPDHVLVRPYVPQLELLPRCAAVVSHAGHNTTCEALAHGVPLVVAPIRDDQPIVADQVVAAGAGVRVKFGRVRATALRDALVAVLEQDGYRKAAARIRESFATAGGPARAAERLEALLGSAAP